MQRIFGLWSVLRSGERSRGILELAREIYGTWVVEAVSCRSWVRRALQIDGWTDGRSGLLLEKEMN